MSTEHPILFSGPMIRAITEGRKTQTRRVCKVYQSPHGERDDAGWPMRRDKYGDWNKESCPYGTVGNRLWVRETFVIESNKHTASADEYPPSFTDGRPTHWQSDDDYGNWWQQCHYRATDPEPARHYGDLSDPHCRWRPSIFMPRWASRITLEITSVRVERVQAISDEDIVAEGIARGELPRSALRLAFSQLWNEINAKRGYGWAVNPWVWTITFKRLSQPERSIVS